MQNTTRMSPTISVTKDVLIGDLPKLSLSDAERAKWMRAAKIATRRDRGQKSEICFFAEPSHVAEHIYLGTTSNALDLEQLSKYHITHVLNCAASHCSLTPICFGKSVKYKKVGPATGEGYDNDTSKKDDKRRPRLGLGPNEQKWEGDIEMAEVSSDAHQSFRDLQPERQRPVKNYSPDQIGLIAELFEDAKEFLEEARSKGGRVLLCCLSGVNRSPAVVVAYLMWLKRWELLKAIRRVRKSRGVILQLDGFVSQLIDFAVRIGTLGEFPQYVNVDKIGSRVQGGDKNVIAGGGKRQADAEGDADDTADSDLASSLPSDDEEFWNDMLRWEDMMLHDDADDFRSDQSIMDGSCESHSDSGATDGSDSDRERLIDCPTAKKASGQKSDATKSVKGGNRSKTFAHRSLRPATLPHAQGVPKVSRDLLV